MPREAEEVERIGAREGWRAKTFGRGMQGQKPFFHVIEFWLENRLMIEVATPAMAQEYLDFLKGAQTATISTDPPPVRRAGRASRSARWTAADIGDQRGRTVVVTGVAASRVALSKRKEPSMKLQNRTILITGGSSGMGFELAKRLLERRNVVIITGRSQEKLESAKRALSSVHTFKSDVGDPTAIPALYDQVVEKFPALDTLINNAGIQRVQKFNLDQGLEDIAREIEICFSGPVRMITQFLPHLKTRKDALVINVSSSAALIPFPISPVYSAAKAALHSFTESLRVQMAFTGVTVIELIPPAVETPLYRDETLATEMKLPKGMDVEVFVKKAIAGIEAGKLEVRPGLANAMKILSRVAPEFTLKQVAKMIPSLGPA